MKAGAKQFFVFWRPLPLLWAAVSVINPAFMTFLQKGPESLARFFGTTMLLPLGAGMTLALVAGRVIHQPAIMILPGAREFYRRGFLLIAMAIGWVLVGLAIWWTGSSVAAGGVTGLVFLCLSTGLLWEPMSRWCGSTWLFALGALAMTVAGFFAEEIRGLADGNPGRFLAAAAAAFFAMSRIFFAKERVRGRAMTVMLFCGANLKTLSRIGLAQKKWAGRDWSRGAVGAADTRGWLAAFSHEWFGAMSWTRACLSMFVVLVLWAGVVFAMLANHLNATRQAFTGPVLAREFHSLIWSVGADGKVPPIIALTACGVALFFFLFVLTYPRMSAFYPMSRRMFSRLALRIAILRTISLTLAASGVLLLVSWLVGVLAGEAFRWKASSLLAVPLALLPVWPWIAGLALPLSYWMWNPTKGMLTVPGLKLLGGGVVGMLCAFALSMFAEELLTWTGLACVTVAMLPGWWWLRARMERFYVRSDLVVNDHV